MKAFQTLTSSNGNTNIYSNGLAMLGDNIFQLFYPSTGTGQTPYLLRTVVPSLANGLSAFTHSHYQLFTELRLPRIVQGPQGPEEFDRPDVLHDSQVEEDLPDRASLGPWSRNLHRLLLSHPD
jgi:hypothetical protein